MDYIFDFENKYNLISGALFAGAKKKPRLKYMNRGLV
jgi:hypothetical protein